MADFARGFGGKSRECPVRQRLRGNHWESGATEGGRETGVAPQLATPRHSNQNGLSSNSVQGA